jgi:heme oxygenase
MTMEPVTLMDCLKEAIQERHARIEGLPYITALTAGTLPLQSYVGQLRAMAVIHATLEHELGQLPLEGLTGLFLSRPSRLAHLRADLAAFDNRYLPDCLAATEQARLIAEQIRRYRLDRPELLSAVLYVLEGTTLGNAVHLPDLKRCFGEQVADASSRYYNGYGDLTAGYWQEFRSIMNSCLPDQGLISMLIQASHLLFDQLEALIAALYPVTDEGWGFTAVTLNPDAGQHPVPDNRSALEAAVTAARRCREEFPYFDLRYQERGKSFAKSDAAWLVTLTGLPRPQLVQQVEWLGRVLGNRGMPRITLERQLELLHEELSRVLPEKRQEWQQLPDVAARLRAERQRLLPTR